MAECESSSSPNTNPVAEKRKCSELDDDDDSDNAEQIKDDAKVEKEAPSIQNQENKWKKQKQLFSFQMTTPIDSEEKRNKNTGPICLKLGIQRTKEMPNVVKTSASVARAFNDDEEEAEEMPPEARMRMRNIGRDTPTSAGPNSFGKTRQGFCDTKKMFEKQIKKKMEDVSF